MAELGKYYIQIVPTTEGISGAITSALGGSDATKSGQKSGSAIGSAMSTAIGTALGGVVSAAAGGITSGINALIGSIGDTAALGDNIDKMSQKLGISAEAYQEWDAIMQHSGTSIDSMKAAFKSLHSAVEEGSDSFSELNLSLTDIAAMSDEELFSATITALQECDDQFLRTSLATDLFGKSAQELGPLLNTSAEETQAMRERVHELGGVMSDEAVKASAGYQDSLQDLGTAFQSVGRNLVSDFLPSMTTTMNGLTDLLAGNTEEGKKLLLEGITGTFKQIPETLRGGAEVIKAVVEVTKDLIPEVVSTISEMLPEVLTSAVDLLKGVLDGVLNALPNLLNTLLDTAMGILGMLSEYLPSLLETVVGVVSELIKNVASFISENGEMLLTTVMDLVTSIILALPELLPELIDAIVVLMGAVVDALLDYLPEFFEASTDMTFALIDGLMEALPKIGASAGKIVSVILSALIEHLPEILIMGVQMQIEFATGIVKAIPKVLSAIVETIFALLYEAQSYIESINWGELGLNIINGIKDGILGAAGNLVSAVTDVGSQAVNGIKNFFGIASPSKLMRDEIGKFIPQGLALGIEDKEDEVSEAMGILGTGTLRGVSASLALAGTGLTASAYAGAGNAPTQVVAPIYIGDRLLDTFVVEATARNNYRTGGR